LNGARIVRDKEQSGKKTVDRNKEISEQEIEEKEERTDGQQNGSAINAAARRARQASGEASRTGFAGCFLAKAATGSGAGNGVANDFPPDSADFIIDPGRNIAAICPQHDCSANEHSVAEKCEQSEHRTVT